MQLKDVRFSIGQSVDSLPPLASQSIQGEEDTAEDSVYRFYLMT